MKARKASDKMRLEKLRDETGLPVARLQDLERRGFEVVRSTRAAELRVAHEARRRKQVLQSLDRLFRAELSPIPCPACGGLLYWGWRTGRRYIKTMCETCRIDEDLVADPAWMATRRG